MYASFSLILNWQEANCDYAWIVINHISSLQEDDEECDNVSEEAVIGFWSGVIWLVNMTVFIAILSKYVVDTIEVIHFHFVSIFLEMKS